MKLRSLLLAGALAASLAAPANADTIYGATVLVPPSWTTANRVPVFAGAMGWNSTLGLMEQWNGTAWAPINGVVSFTTGDLAVSNSKGQVADASTAGAPAKAPSGIAMTGAVPTPTGACPVNTQTGGNTAGTFKANGLCSASTVILTFAQSAPTGWACDTHDMTTPTDLMNETATSANSVTFTGTMASADVVAFKCEGY